MTFQAKKKTGFTLIELLMSDQLIWSSIHQGWIYNHGTRGPSFPYEDLLPNISGTNNLYGDGSVNWKNRSKFDIKGMQYQPVSVGNVPFTDVAGYTY